MKMIFSFFLCNMCHEHTMKSNRFSSAALLILVGLLLINRPYRGQRIQDLADQTVYSDSFVSGWQDWSYGGISSSYNNTSPIHGGMTSIAVTCTGGWSGLQIGYGGSYLDVSTQDTFRFWIHGGTRGGQPIRVTLSFRSGSVQKDIIPNANTWTLVDIPLTDLSSREVYSIQWFNNSAGPLPAFYLDDLVFTHTGLPTPTTLPPAAGPALTVDATADRHPISPFIYGINLAKEEVAGILHLPVRRWGGNSTTRYNWQLDMHNTGSDWYYENIPDDTGMIDHFVEQDRRTGTKTILTMPLIGWTPKARRTGHPYDCGFSIIRYGAQDSVDPWDSNCGNGLRNGVPITGNNPQDTSTQITTAFVTSWIDHLKSRFGSAAEGGVLFYNLDNEPMLWNSTHRDVHPAAVGYDEIRDRTWNYAAAIKAADSSAWTLGPVLWGWTAYFWSALDQESGGSWWQHPPDRLAHGNAPFIEWYLRQMKVYQDTHGIRLLDFLDLHYYPQAGGVSLSSAGSSSIQTLRLRSTRSLWDPAYRDESWIDESVYLIPRMKQWVAANYPGTKLAITEYNWGALDHINGALAQADILGIFGREGLDLATLWGAPDTGTAPGILAFCMYRNYDGLGSAFGETSIRAVSTDQAKLSVYAARRSKDGALTLMVINKTDQSLVSSVSLSGFSSADAASVYRYSAANPSAIIHGPDQTITVGRIQTSFPADSITLFVISPRTSFPSRLYLPLIAGVSP